MQFKFIIFLFAAVHIWTINALITSSEEEVNINV